MSNEASTSKNETGKKSRLLRRAAQRVGLVAVDNQREVEDRPPVGVFVPRHMSLMEYARRNAALAGIDKEQNRYEGLLRRVRNLAETYGSYLNGTYKLDATKYGFSKEHPITIFRWNMDEVSQRTSEDLLYVMGAMPSANPEQYDAGNGIKRIRQEYTSSTGLSFIDVRDAVVSEVPRANFHEMYAYLPVQD